MKGFGMWVLLLMLGVAVVCLWMLPAPGVDPARPKPNMGLTLTTRSRKLKENFRAENDYTGDGSGINIDDYAPNDPVPSSKAAAIRPGPIQHGTPLMPYLPQPEPPAPNEPPYVGFP